MRLDDIPCQVFDSLNFDEIFFGCKNQRIPLNPSVNLNHSGKTASFAIGI